MSSASNSKAAFSLTEILIALGIIIIFITLPVLAYGNYSKKTRDEKRKTDISRVAQALEQYKAEKGVYPPDLSTLQTEGFIPEMPVDPKTGESYDYSSDTLGYKLIADLENDVRNADGSTGPGVAIVDSNNQNPTEEIIAQLTQGAGNNPSPTVPSKTPYISPTGARAGSATITPPPCTGTIVCSGACQQITGRCDDYASEKINCLYTTRSGFPSCQPMAAPNQPCTYDGTAADCSAGTGCLATYCRPNCNAGPVCAGVCSQVAGRCAPPGSYSSTMGSCTYKTLSGGGTCYEVAAPNQPCTISSGHACTGLNVCVSNYCATPTPSNTPTPVAQPFVRKLVPPAGGEQFYGSAFTNADGSLWFTELLQESYGDYSSIAIRKFNQSGTQLSSISTKQNPTEPNTQYRTSIPTSDGGILTATYQVYGLIPPDNNNWYYGTVLRKYNAAGTLQWTVPLKTPGTKDLLIQAMKEHSSGGYVVAGRSNGWSTSGFGISYAALISPSGTVSWSRVIGSLSASATWGSWIRGVGETATGDITLLAENDQSGYTAGNADVHYYRLSYAAGSLLAAKRYGTAANEYLTDSNQPSLSGGGFAFYLRPNGYTQDPNNGIMILNGDGTVRGAYRQSTSYWYSSLGAVQGSSDRITAVWRPYPEDSTYSDRVSQFVISAGALTTEWSKMFRESGRSCYYWNIPHVSNGVISGIVKCSDIESTPYGLSIGNNPTTLLFRTNTSGSIPACAHYSTPTGEASLPSMSALPTANITVDGSFNSFNAALGSISVSYVNGGQSTVSAMCY